MKVCTYCGHATDTSLGQIACAGCGSELPEKTASEPLPPPSRTTPPPLPNDEELFVGTRANYYVDSWNRIDASGNSASLNLAAFFLTGYWMAYRRMYGWALLVLVGRVTLRLLALQGMLPSLIFSGISLTICVACGFYGNALYRKHVAARLQAIPTSACVDRRQQALRSQGGTDPLMPLVFAAMFAGPLFVAKFIPVARELLSDAFQGLARPGM